jgi:hypothetical protein
MNTATNDHGKPYCVAIVAMGPSHRDYLDECIQKTSRWKVADETWAINAMAGVIEHDRAFIMDDLRYFQKQARTVPHLAGYQDWLSKPGRPPIYTSVAHPEVPSSVTYPLQEVVAKLGLTYFNTTVAYAVAYAIHIGVREMRLYGMDFTDKTNRAFAEAGRACVEHWLRDARWRGINVAIAPNSSLMDTATGRTLYGYSEPPVVKS